jgi:hypothetical protein
VEVTQFQRKVFRYATNRLAVGIIIHAGQAHWRGIAWVGRRLHLLDTVQGLANVGEWRPARVSGGQIREQLRSRFEVPNCSG